MNKDPKDLVVKMAYQDHQGLLDCQELQDLTAHQGRKELLAQLVLVVLPVFQALEGLQGPRETLVLVASKEMKDHKENLGCKEVQDLTAHQDLSVNLDLLEGPDLPDFPELLVQRENVDPRD